MPKIKSVLFAASIALGAAQASEGIAQVWHLEAAEGCTIHQQQGNTTVILGGDKEITVFGFSKPHFKDDKAKRTFEVFFDGPTLAGREKKWGWVEMGTASFHQGAARIFVATPSFVRNLRLQSSVIFVNVDDPRDRTTIKLGSPTGPEILDVCVATPE